MRKRGGGGKGEQMEKRQFLDRVLAESARVGMSAPSTLWANTADSAQGYSLSIDLWPDTDIAHDELSVDEAWGWLVGEVESGATLIEPDGCGVRIAATFSPTTRR